jgi:arsenate reductase
LNDGQGFVLQDIKSEPITENQLEQMYQMAGSYEALFTRRSRKYRAWGLHEKELGETDYQRLILEEYTFLKRPVVIIGEEIFIGNAKTTVEGALAKLG